MRFLFISALFILPFSVFAKARFKTSCSTKELKIKNCIIEMNSLRVGLSSQKIRFSDGPWTSIADFPANEKVTEWQEAKLEKVGQKKFLLLKVWQKLENEVTLEEFHWVVLEPQERDLHLRLDKAIGKRKMRKENKAPLIQDELEQTKLWFKDGRYLWRVGKESGEIKDGV